MAGALLVRSERGLERFDETFLSARAEVRILVRALLGKMASTVGSRSASTTGLSRPSLGTRDSFSVTDCGLEWVSSKLPNLR
jgi:hypothetical protein